MTKKLLGGTVLSIEDAPMKRHLEKLGLVEDTTTRRMVSFRMKPHVLHALKDLTSDFNKLTNLNLSKAAFLEKLIMNEVSKITKKIIDREEKS